MILYYTGTGNSAYVAKKIAGTVDDTYLNLFEKLRDKDYSEIVSERAFVVVCPTYGWQIPHILRDWLKKVKFSGPSDMYFVMTCGAEIGNAAQYLVRLCESIGMNYKGCMQIVMPENYIALFDAPEEAEARKIIKAADIMIDNVSGYISFGIRIPERPSGAIDRVKSSLVNAVFYPAVVHARKFRVSDDCTGCGKCVKNCVMKNISLKDKKPVWGNQCTHCMACICGCPKGAIEYGRASKGKPRYQCPK